MRLTMRYSLVSGVVAVAGGVAFALTPLWPAGATDSAHPVIVAQANIPPTGMGDKDMAMASANMAEEERMKRRYPQPIRVGALIGARVSDSDSRTIGFVRHVVRTAQGQIDLVVDCCGWFGFGARPVLVPIAVLGALGHDVASLDWPRSAYASAPTWQDSRQDSSQGSGSQSTAGTVLADDDTVRIALARR